MEAKLQYDYLDCWNKSYENTLHKEESQDCVVPDTMPDVTRVLYTLGSLLIRSKDLSAGKLKLEANIPARVVFLDEEGGINSLEVNVPLYLSAEDEALDEDGCCIADIKIRSLETKLLNPRKVLVKAIVSAEVCCFAKGRTAYCVGVADAEHIHLKRQEREISFVSAVSEKTFALTDEQALPLGLENGEILCSAVEVFSEEIKNLGTKLILKGRVKSCLLVHSEERITPLEATTDFSQIVDCGVENAVVSACIIPSGAHHYISSQSGEVRLCMEYHMVAQLKCCETKNVECICDAYSNRYALELGHSAVSCEKVLARPDIRSSLRQLYEVKDMGDVISCSHIWGSGKLQGDKICLPLSVQCLYAEENAELKTEKLSTELSFDIPAEENCRISLKNPELSECSIAALPGGIELRLAARAEPMAVSDEIFSCLSGIKFDENSPVDLAAKPSLVLLRMDPDADLWTLARENCSTVEAIIEANHTESGDGSREKLLIIPKSL